MWGAECAELRLSPSSLGGGLPASAFPSPVSSPASPVASPPATTGVEGMAGTGSPPSATGAEGMAAGGATAVAPVLPPVGEGGAVQGAGETSSWSGTVEQPPLEGPPVVRTTTICVQE